MSQQSNQSGFAVVEAILVVVILAIVGFTGWFVWYSKQATDKTLSDTTKSSQSTLPKTTAKTVSTFAECKAAVGSKILTSFPEQCVTKAGKTFTNPTTTQSSSKYLVVKEWGVKFPYSGSDTLSYKTTDDSAVSVEIISADLARSYPGCDKFGAGDIGRGTATDVYGADMTYAEAYSQNPSSVTKAGNYYYAFFHDQAACADNPTDASNAAENAANAFVKLIVPNVVNAN